MNLFQILKSYFQMLNAILEPVAFNMIYTNYIYIYIIYIYILYNIYILYIYIYIYPFATAVYQSAVKLFYFIWS